MEGRRDDRTGGRGLGPDDLRSPIRTRFRGYDRRAVDELLAAAAASLGELEAEHARLQSDVRRLERELAEAQAKVEELERERAKRGEQPAAERDRLLAEAKSLEALISELGSGYRAFLLAALELLESVDGGGERQGVEAPRARPSTPLGGVRAKLEELRRRLGAPR